jgi:lysyl-tRNA synthetase class 1
MTSERELALAAKAWPFKEAGRVVKRLGAAAPAVPDKGYVLFETGYGPSGLPHIGTFGEVARTTMVRHAFEVARYPATFPTRTWSPNIWACR